MRKKIYFLVQAWKNEEVWNPDINDINNTIISTQILFPNFFKYCLILSPNIIKFYFQILSNIISKYYQILSNIISKYYQILSPNIIKFYLQLLSNVISKNYQISSPNIIKYYFQILSNVISKYYQIWRSLGSCRKSVQRCHQKSDASEDVENWLSTWFLESSDAQLSKYV